MLSLYNTLKILHQMCSKETHELVVPSAANEACLVIVCQAQTYSLLLVEKTAYNLDPRESSTSQTIMTSSSTPPLPQTFTTFKNRILDSLSIPTDDYTDASPKGSIDTAILPLIQRLNSLEGIVTTSSCAGRVSVFVEGSKAKGRGSRVYEDGAECEEQGDVGVKGEGKGRKAVPGGKGLGGRWAYVSHEPICAARSGDDEAPGRFMEMFGLVPKSEGEVRKFTNDARYVRFAFEPMVSYACCPYPMFSS